MLCVIVEYTIQHSSRALRYMSLCLSHIRIVELIILREPLLDIEVGERLLDVTSGPPHITRVATVFLSAVLRGT